MNEGMYSYVSLVLSPSKLILEFLRGTPKVPPKVLFKKYTEESLITLM